MGGCPATCMLRVTTWRRMDPKYGCSRAGMEEAWVSRLDLISPESLAVLTANGPWDTYRPGGPEVDAGLVSQTDRRRLGPAARQRAGAPLGRCQPGLWRPVEPGLRTRGGGLKGPPSE